MSRQQPALVLAALALLTATGVAAEPAADDAAVKALLPAGWQIQLRATADLDGDGRPDEVVLASENDPAKRYDDEARPTPAVDLNTRRLLVLQRTAAGLRVMAGSERFVPSPHTREDLCEVWSADGLRAERNGFRLQLRHEFACGAGAGGDASFQFRVEQSRVRLIGLEGDWATRDAEAHLSINFLTGQGERREVSDPADRRRTTLHRLPLARSPRFLEQLAPAGCYLPVTGEALPKDCGGALGLLVERP